MYDKSLERFEKSQSICNSLFYFPQYYNLILLDACVTLQYFQVQLDPVCFCDIQESEQNFKN